MNRYIEQGWYSSKICWGSSLPSPRCRWDRRHHTGPLLPKKCKGSHWDPAQKSRCKRDLWDYCPPIPAITLPLSPGCPPTGTAPLQQHAPTATRFPVFAGYRHIKLPMEREKKALLPPCNYQISLKMRKN